MQVCRDTRRTDLVTVDHRGTFGLMSRPARRGGTGYVRPFSGGTTRIWVTEPGPRVFEENVTFLC